MNTRWTAPRSAPLAMPLHQRVRSRTLATFLSFLWPGLGQWYTRRLLAAVLFAVPPTILLVVFTAATSIGAEMLLARLFQPGVALIGAGVVALVGLWRLWSMMDALRLPRSAIGRARRRGALATFAVLALAVVGMHGTGAYYLYSFHRAAGAIFDAPSDRPVTAGPRPDGQVATPVEEPPPGQPDPESQAPPGPRERVTVLFVGLDSSPFRTDELTDSLLIASLDPETDRVDLVSFPRDLAQLPLYRGGIYPDKINTFYRYARENPDEFPEGDITALRRQLGYLLGIPIHYYASVNLPGFRQMIDLAGGIDVVNEKLIDDPTYAFTPDRIGFRLEPGPVHLDGETALAYVRSRMGATGSDFERARRQQGLLLAFREKLKDPSLIPQLPALLEAASQSVRTNLPPDRLSEMLGLVRSSTDGRVKTAVLGPRRYAELIPPAEIRGLYALRPRMDEIAALSVRLFGEDSRYTTDAPPVIDDTAAASPSPRPTRSQSGARDESGPRDDGSPQRVDPTPRPTRSPRPAPRRSPEPSTAMPARGAS